jgi:hypothetical protein
MENLETVYIFTNIGMPDLIKIGYTAKDVKERARELFTTGVPHPFDIFYAGLVPNGRHTESLVHKIFAEYREKTNREFFRMTPEKAKLAFLVANPIDITPKDEEYLTPDEIIANNIYEKKRLSNFTFEQADISYGSLLHFAKDESITCIVYSENTVVFDGHIITLTEAARKTGLITHKEIQGPKYWMYENELLTERRKRIQGL